MDPDQLALLESYCHMLSSLGLLLGSLLSYVELIGPASGIIIVIC